MCLDVKNLFNDKKVILSREDILKVVLYAIQNNIVDVTFDCPVGEIECYGMDQTVNINELDYDIRLVEESGDAI